MKKASTSRTASSLRIIAGSLRGRRISFAAAGIRPTGDRIRETLFNWLGAGVAGSSCLDLFAGTGALGLEAISRGAAAVVFVERQAQAARDIEQNLLNLGCKTGRVIRGDAKTVNLDGHKPFNIVFLDPPFGSPDLADLCKLLECGDYLADNALVYVEVAKKSGLPAFPPSWRLLRDKTAGQVRYALVQRSNSNEQE